jgi:peptidoglycan/LPS O-acetylase OafA/YrhL
LTTNLLQVLSRGRSPILAESAMRPPGLPATAHVAALTGVRALAALWVFLFHCWIMAQSPGATLELLFAQVDLTPLFRFGWLGVDLFFVLSGFLLTRQAWGKIGRGKAAGWLPSQFGETYWSFLRRRVLRVYPAYYAVISVLLVLAALHVHRSPPEKADLLLHLVMFHNVVARYLESINDVLWSIPFEWQFYLVFPLLFIALRRTNLIALYITAALLALGIKEWAAISNDGYVELYLPARLDEFVAGMCAATFAEHLPLRRRPALIAFVVGLTCFVATAWVWSAYPLGGHYLDALGLARPLWIEASICLFLLGLSGESHPGVGLFSNRLVVWLGLISYSIYLVHVPVLVLLSKLGAYPMQGSAVPGSLSRVIAMAVPAVIALSAALYYLIERPFQASGRRGFGEPGQAAWWSRNPVAVLSVWAVLQFAFLVAVGNL